MTKCENVPEDPRLHKPTGSSFSIPPPGIPPAIYNAHDLGAKY
jgi:hypothetical protein